MNAWPSSWREVSIEEEEPEGLGVYGRLNMCIETVCFFSAHENFASLVHDPVAGRRLKKPWNGGDRLTPDGCSKSYLL